MSFDELYDEMLSLEFSSRGRHAKPGTTGDPAAAVAAVMTDDVYSKARHAKAETVDAATEPAADGGRERPTGLARYRTAGLVGAGGLACATIGAFLGGLGGYFTVSPAGAHAVASTSQDSPLADAVNHAAHAATSVAPDATLASADFSQVAGGLTSSGWGLGSILASASPTAGLGGLHGSPVLGGSGTGGTGGSTGGDNSGDGTTTPTDPGSTPCAGLGCIIESLSGSLNNVGDTLAGNDPTGLLATLTPSLDGILTMITTDLSNPGAFPVGSLPVPSGSGLPTGVLPTGLSGLPGTTAGPTGGSTGAGGGVGTVVGGVTGALGGVTSSSPVPTSTSPLSGVTAPITSILPTTTTSSGSTSTTTTSSGTSSSGTTSPTLTVPLPLPTDTSTTNLGPVSVGTTSGTGSTTGGLTLTLGGL